MTRQEMIAAALLAASEDASMEYGERMINTGREAEHSGDCTKEPWTCLRCLREEHMKMAERLEANLETFGLSIAGGG